MAKKTFVRARLVKGARWYIDFTVFRSETGEETRHRQDFFLNDIEDLANRELVGTHLVRCIESFVGTETTRGRVASVPEITVEDAVARAMDAKLSTSRKNTHKGYLNHVGAFIQWAEMTSWTGRPVGEFSKRHAREFFDWVTKRRKYAGRTLNNCIAHLRALWTEMIERELAGVNPWKSIKLVREEEKRRRAFTDAERRIVAAEIEKTDYWLFRGVLLQFFCYVRPCEIARLKFKDFNFEKGIVKIGFAESKVWRTRYVTIPRSIMHYFIDGKFERYPANYFILGSSRRSDGQVVGEPSTVALNENRAYKRHCKILHRLKERGDIHDTKGLTWYSWKDTGISLHARRTSPLSTRDQAGHTEFDMTLTYYHKEEINAEYAALPNDLF